MGKNFDAGSALRNYDWKRALDHGGQLALEASRVAQDINERSIMWALLKEAAKVSAICYSKTPRTGLPIKSAMPESPQDITPWQMMSAYLRGEVEEMPTGEEVRVQPNAAEITRAEMVLEVWHRSALRHKGDWSRMRKAVYLKACNVPDRKVRAVTGFTKQRIHHAKDAAMNDMWEMIRTMDFRTK